MNGIALSHLPAQFCNVDTYTLKTFTPALSAYITRKYSKYGYAKSNSIAYNQEFTPEGQERRINPDRYRWVENVTDGLRFVGASHDIIRLRHTGYFTDNYQDGTVHGCVYQLPARHGLPQYVPAVNDPDNSDCACVDFSSVTYEKEDAARWADSMAEAWAEREREYRAKEDAENRIEEIEQEIKDAYTAFRKIAKEIRANCEALRGISVVRQLVRHEWLLTKQCIRSLRAERVRVEREGIRY